MGEELRDFVRESNRIEGITRPPTAREIAAHRDFLALDRIEIDDLCGLVWTLAQRSIRDEPGLNVYVGDHTPPPGGPDIRVELQALLWNSINGGTPYAVHQHYETLHPFMDGNGRSGRALWLWMMLRDGRDPYVLHRGFLHTWYYQSLSERVHAR